MKHFFRRRENHVEAKAPKVAAAENRVTKNPMKSEPLIVAATAEENSDPQPSPIPIGPRIETCCCILGEETEEKGSLSSLSSTSESSYFSVETSYEIVKPQTTAIFPLNEAIIYQQQEQQQQERYKKHGPNLRLDLGHLTTKNNLVLFPPPGLSATGTLHEYCYEFIPPPSPYPASPEQKRQHRKAKAIGLGIVSPPLLRHDEVGADATSVYNKASPVARSVAEHVTTLCPPSLESATTPMFPSVPATPATCSPQTHTSSQRSPDKKNSETSMVSEETTAHPLLPPPPSSSPSSSLAFMKPSTNWIKQKLLFKPLAFEPTKHKLQSSSSHSNIRTHSLFTDLPTMTTSKVKAATAWPTPFTKQMKCQDQLVNQQDTQQVTDIQKKRYLRMSKSDSQIHKILDNRRPSSSPHADTAEKIESGDFQAPKGPTPGAVTKKSDTKRNWQRRMSFLHTSERSIGGQMGGIAHQTNIQDLNIIRLVSAPSSESSLTSSTIYSPIREEDEHEESKNTRDAADELAKIISSYNDEPNDKSEESSEDGWWDDEDELNRSLEEFVLYV